MITSTITNNTIILPKTGYYDSNEETESDRSSTISIFHLTSRYCSARVTVSLAELYRQVNGSIPASYHNNTR